MTNPLVPASGQNPFRILDMPRILFDEISARLGIGEVEEIDRYDGVFRMRRLDPNHRHVGFAGAIGHRTFVNDAATLHLWPRVPEPGDKDMVYEVLPILRITAHTASDGVWTATHGNLKKEKARAELDTSYGLNLELTGALLVAMILVRASDLVRDPTCVKRTFWDGQTELDD